MDDLDNISIETLREILAQNFLHVFAISILYYDHLITTGNEINFLWKRPKGPSTFWFFLNRYFSFFGNLVVIIVSFMTIPEASCKAYNLFRQLLLVLNQVLVCILLTLRIYALYGRSLRILVCMVGSGAVLLIVACWSLFGQKHLASGPLPETGCHVGLTRETAIHIASAWEALMMYDTMIFSFTLYRTWTTRRDRGVTRIQDPLLSLVLRDGALYYAAMALANLSNILTFYLCGPFLRGALSTVASSISVTMMSRIMLNLHQNADVGIYSTAQTTSTMQ
ncbi:hypothetical protein BDQ17DRAFT_1283761 [Cyathus striatus]|nr:hypothetical protein BDQ17DRAFT_1283761 [Cyathus striatus]